MSALTPAEEAEFAARYARDKAEEADFRKRFDEEQAFERLYTRETIDRLREEFKVLRVLVESVARRKPEVRVVEVKAPVVKAPPPAPVEIPEPEWTFQVRSEQVRFLQRGKPVLTFDVAALKKRLDELADRPVYLGGSHGAGSSGTGTGSVYTGTAAVSVGGITLGTAFSAQNLQQMFTALLAPPYAAPAFTSFAITGVATSIEVGTSFGPGVTFTWSTSNPANILPNTIGITDTTLSTTIATAQPNSGSYVATLAGAITNTSAATHSFGISAQNNIPATFTGALTIAWQWTLYYGANANPTLANTDILALASTVLAAGYAGTYVESGAGFKYLCLADAAGGQINSVKDQSTGFNVPMATSSDNAAYSNVDGGGFSYALVSVTNAQSVTTNVRVYRSTNSLGGAVTLLVT